MPPVVQHARNAEHDQYADRQDQVVNLARAGYNVGLLNQREIVILMRELVLFIGPKSKSAAISQMRNASVSSAYRFNGMVLRNSEKPSSVLDSGRDERLQPPTRRSAR